MYPLILARMMKMVWYLRLRNLDSELIARDTHKLIIADADPYNEFLITLANFYITLSPLSLG